MNELQIFANDMFGEIRTTVIDGEPYFVGRDVADALGYKKPNDALSSHVDGDDSVKRGVIDSLGRLQDAIFINESGLYSLIFGSKLPSAKQFKRWVTSDILPTIRKHGMYATDELLANPDLAIATFQALKAEREKNERLKEQVKKQRPLVEFARTVQSTKDNILVRECSKLASNYIGVDIGEKGLYQKLRDWKLLLKKRNEPSKLAYNQGVLVYIERVVYDKYGIPHLTHITKVTPKGQAYIINKLIKEYTANTNIFA